MMYVCYYLRITVPSSYCKDYFSHNGNLKTNLLPVAVDVLFHTQFHVRVEAFFDIKYRCDGKLSARNIVSYEVHQMAYQMV